MAPSIANFTQETGKITKEVQTNIKQGNYSQKRVVESIKNNPYMKTVTTAFENAVRQLKTGNLNDMEAAEKAGMEAMGFSEDDFDFGDFSFDDTSWGDDDDSSVQDITINNDNDYNNVHTGADISSLSNMVTDAATAQVKSAEAVSNSLVAVMSTSITQNRQIGDSIVSGLDAIAQNTAQLVSYNSESMQKFIDASIEYYSHADPLNEENQQNNDRNNDKSALDVYEGNKFNVQSYIETVKKQATRHK